MTCYEGVSLRSFGGLAHDAYLGVRLEHHADSSSDDFVVVCKHYSDYCFASVGTLLLPVLLGYIGAVKRDACAVWPGLYLKCSTNKICALLHACKATSRFLELRVPPHQTRIRNRIRLR